MLEICILMFGTEVAKSSASWFWFIQILPLKLQSKMQTEFLDQKENHDTGKHFPFTKVHLGVEVFEKHKTDPN